MFTLISYLLLMHACSTIFSQTTKVCPSVPSGCRCSHKNKGYKIVCNLMTSVSFHDLPQNVSLDIDLSSNMLTSINSSMFPNPNKIRKLIIRDNELTSIGDNTFIGFKSLRKLDLSMNYLVELREDTFVGLQSSSINTLDLTENRILSINKLAFNGLNIDKLLLKRQLKSRNEKADLLAYNDFTSLAYIRYLDLSQNQFLCDCNLEWLTQWSNQSEKLLSTETKCYYPKPLRGVTVKSLVGTWIDGSCNKYERSFTLPFFQLYPSSNQIMFEDDALYLICQSTWTSSSFVVWNQNGVDLKQKLLLPGVTIQHRTDLHLGIYVSTLVISRLQANYQNITCNLNVYGSGGLSASLKIHTLKRTPVLCPSKNEKTDQGILSLPTSFNGATAQITCPYGGIRTKQAFFYCRNETWKMLDTEDCFFSRNTTRQLQDFFEIAASRNIKRITNMAASFNKFFQRNYNRIQTKFDLYYIFQILREVMLAFKERKGVEYTGFFWSSIGIVAKKHLMLPTMQHMLYNKPANWRFQYLLESHISQEFQKLYPKRYIINNHKTMATYSALQQTGNLLNCYVVPTYAVTNGNLTVKCLHFQNDTLHQLSNVFVQIVSARKAMHVTFLVFETNTFFPLNKNATYHLISPVVGVNIGVVRNGLTYYNNTQQTLFTFTSKKNHRRPRLMHWSYEHGTGGNWTETDCKMLTRKKPNLTQYQCFFRWKRNLTYLALVGDREKAVIYPAKYLETIIYIGAAISCVFLVITFLFYALIRSLRFNRGDASMLLNLCITLILMELIFAFGIHRTDHSFLCQIVAVGLHYLTLAALLWLGCGAVILIVLLKKKDRIQIKEQDPIFKYYLVAWGLPTIICGITVAFDAKSYGTTDYCWLLPDASLGAFIGPGGVILLVDLALVCYLHALTNRIYPDLLDDYVEGDASQPDNHQCNVRICKYKVKPQSIYEKTFPLKEELLLYIRGCLSALLWLCLVFTLLVMMYTYSENTTAAYLYYLFTYCAALCNVLLSFSLFLFHCYRREDLKAYFAMLPFVCFVNPKNDMLQEALLNKENDNEVAPPHSPSITVRAFDDSALSEKVVSEHPSDYLEATSGVFGLNDNVQSVEGSHISPTLPSETCEVFEINCGSINNMPVRVQSDVSIDQGARVVTDSDCNGNIGNVTDQVKFCVSQTDASEQERQSVGKENSIGDCSLTSSRNNRRVRATNPDIPDSIRSFVPENWRPAQRRRRTKKGSYYPYFMTDLTTNSASVAYSSNASSVTSTTVSGVPLFINKKQAANNLAMYNELFNPKRNNASHRNRMGPVRQPLNQNYPVNIPIKLPPAPNPFHQYPLSSGPMSPSLSGAQNGMSPPHQYPDYRNGYVTSDGSLTNKSESHLFEAVDEKPDEECSRISEEVEEIQSDVSSEVEPIKIAPLLYIPIPHLTKKQFVLRDETSV